MKAACPAGTTLTLKQQEILDAWKEKERLAERCYMLYSELNEMDKQHDLAKTRFWRAIERLEPKYDGREHWQIEREASMPEKADGPYLVIRRVSDDEEKARELSKKFVQWMEMSGNGQRGPADAAKRPGHYI